jgi:hypothetical protein
MSLKGLLASVLLALVLLAGLVPGAGATEQWCEVDPLVVIMTPGGNLVPVFVTNRARGGREYLPALVKAHISHTAKPAKGGTAVEVYVTIAAIPGVTDAASIASTGPLGTGAVYDTTRGTTGQQMTLEFKLDVL